MTHLHVAIITYDSSMHEFYGDYLFKSTEALS